MVNSTKAQQKFLFVGSKRICQQIAYVLDITNYALVEKLTAQNYDQYRDYQIYVCEFKRKSRKFVKVGKEVTQFNLQYLDDICRAIDEAYYANRKRHEQENHAQNVNKLPAATNQPVANQPMPQPLRRRVVCWLKRPLRVAWHMYLRMKQRVKDACINNKIKHYQLQNRKQLQKHLQRLKPSELLLYVLHAPIDPKIQCTHMENYLRINANGDVKGCCSAILPFGNLLQDGELPSIYHGTYARIVKLSSLNHSYCLCNFGTWCKGYCAKGQSALDENYEEIIFPKIVTVAYDHTCNLCCKSCRSKPYVMNDAEQEWAAVLTDKLIRSGYLEQSQSLTVASMGEVFYSPYYRQILATDRYRNAVNIFTNGTLFNETNWRLVAGKYTTIDVRVSVDAATAETYRKLRGADFDNLMRNLTMISNLRRQKQIRNFNLNFVIQRDNYREMPAFVELGQTLGVDHIQFQRLSNWGSFAPQEYLDCSMLIDETYLAYELWCLLQDPIFNDPIVDLKGIQRYIDASECRYRQRYEKEQKQRRSV